MELDTKLHFLIVNDSSHIQRVIVALLKEIGYLRVSEASDGAMALRAIKTAAALGNPVQFIITDCAMPFLDGVDMIRILRAEPQMNEIPILMITESASKDNVLTAHNAGADGYLVRPFNARKFHTQIESLLIAKGVKLAPVSLKSFRPFLRGKLDVLDS
jgi:two-component system, chemotaxis family, chemotaxis protein CheY